MELLGRLIEQHGWHVLAELTVFLVTVVVAALWLRALFQGRARPVACPACGRIASRANPRCPRCRAALEGEAGAGG
jgi:predicted amidophosphoribosyltransferase